MATRFHATVVEKIEGSFQDDPVPTFARDLSLGAPQEPARGNVVNTVAGVRRCGKTYRLFQEMGALLDAGVERERILYFNFADERLKPYEPALLADVVDSYHALWPHVRERGAYLFFDEIQDVPEWGAFLRRLVDEEKATIYVTGSSSKLLSSQISSEFRGRALTRELFPMSFSEYVRFHDGDGIATDKLQGQAAFSASDKAVLRNRLGTYLAEGGFIATQGMTRAEAYALLQEYASRTVAEDIVERFDLSNARVAQAFCRRCIASSGRELSVNKVFNDFKSLGVTTSRESLSGLLDYFEEAYLLVRVRERSRSLSANPRSVSKIYAADPGLVAAYSPSAATDVGQRLETAVCNALRRRAGLARKDHVTRLLLGSGSSRREIDFAVGDVLLDAPPMLVQVTVSLGNGKTRKRELSALDAAMGAFGVEEAWVVTLDDEEEVQRESGTVHVVPAWKWLLG